MGNHRESRRKTTLRFYIKVFMVVCLGFVLSMTTVHASSDDKLEEIYHVYVENKYIGKVDDKSVVQQVATKKLDKLKDRYKDLDLILGESIDIVPEKVFNPSYENDNVRDELKDILTVEAQSYAIVIDDEEIGYFATEDSAEDALKKRSEEHTSELQSRGHLVCRLLLEKKKRTARK